MVAQAVYAVFYHSFPDSRHDKFGPLFRKDLLDTVTEWYVARCLQDNLCVREDVSVGSVSIFAQTCTSEH